MSVVEVRPKAPIPMMQCQGCRMQSAKIGDMKNWTPAPGGYVCEKQACRALVGLPPFVPPDERR